ncbi:MAG TPA: zinc ribbon domain-containing protein [Thermoplasmata archaeon]|nr:zinc ribbon domain-containing protein [Thermoplasmata archaeon]
MFCPHCGAAVPDGTLFCPACGTGLGPRGAAAPLAAPSAGSPLASAAHLVMVWDKLALSRNYRFEDAAGTVLGEAQAEFAFPLRYTVTDPQGQVVLVLDGGRERLLQVAYWVHDANGAVLATFRVKSSVLSRRYGITVGDVERYLLWTDATGYQYRIEEVGSARVLATAARAMAVRTSRTQIDIVDDAELDRRVVLGGMILAEWLATHPA